ncbi:DNA-binding protein [Streptomyces fagopyri]|uniref:DNA-binding protein n=1 Tax=Streptomyces fagopyri TaxID=2662397 RepID=UPI0038087158
MIDDESVPTLDELRKWPATVSVTRAAQALGVSRSHLYALANRDACPVRMLPAGGAKRVVTASLIRVLSDEPAQAPAVV